MCCRSASFEESVGVGVLFMNVVVLLVEIAFLFFCFFCFFGS